MKLAFWKKTPSAPRPACGNCGHDGIEVHALASWDYAKQDWQVSEVLDRCTCPECGDTDAKLVWR